jgi:hypothetical protein
MAGFLGYKIGKVYNERADMAKSAEISSRALPRRTKWVR